MLIPCEKCGNEISSSAEVCPACGTFTNNSLQEKAIPTEHKQVFWIGVFSMVAWIIPIVGLILSTVGIRKSYPNRNVPYVKEAFIFSCLGFIFSLFYLIVSIVTAESLL